MVKYIIGKLVYTGMYMSTNNVKCEKKEFYCIVRVKWTKIKWIILSSVTYFNPGTS